MNRKFAGYLGLCSVALFWIASFIFGALRPSYSHVANTISELGAVGTPNSGLWNLIGFGLFGILLAVVGAKIASEVNPNPSIWRMAAMVLMVVAGLAVAGQGALPAEMIDGVADVNSAATRAHFVSSLISAAAWIVGVLLLVRPMSRNPDWRGLHVVSIVLVVLVIAASLGLRGVLPDGLAQRVGNAIFCCWYIVMSLRLIALERGSKAA
jgi:hypothetical membrane protein